MPLPFRPPGMMPPGFALGAPQPPPFGPPFGPGLGMPQGAGPLAMGAPPGPPGMMGPQPGPTNSPMPGASALGMGLPAAPPPQPQIDPEMIARMLAQLAPPQPIYPSWFKGPPSKPDPTGVYEIGIKKHEDLRLWRQAVYADLRMLRFQDQGIFEDDKILWEAHIIDDYQSPELIADFMAAKSYLTEATPRIVKDAIDEKLQVLARRYALAMTWLRHQEEMRWAEGNADLRFDEAHFYLAHGMIVKRRVIDLDDADYPFDVALIDPCQCVPEWEGKRGLRRFWRVYRSTIGQLAAAYGDLPKSQRERLGNAIGSSSSWDDDTEIPYVVEYWDRWWRCVTIASGTQVVPVTAHEYGEVPITIGYGPLGDPMSAVSPAETALKDKSGALYGVDTNRNEDRVYQSVGYVRYSKEAHKVAEAVMRRMLYYLKKSADPAIIRYRTNIAASQASPEMDSTPGAVNEAIMGEERLEPFLTGAPFEVQAILAHLQQGNAKIMLPPLAHGLYNQSNLSGVQGQVMAETGVDKFLLPWMVSYGRFIERDLARAGRFWRNWGHLAKYAGEEPRPFMVPNPTRRRQGEAPAFELTRELIDAVGPDVRVKLGRFRKQDAVPLSQAAKILTDLGIPFAYLAEEWFDVPNYPDLQEEWREEQAMHQAYQLPEFAKTVTIPAAFAEEIAESTGDPERQQFLAAMLEAWETFVLGGMAGEAGGTGAPGGPMPPEGMNPPAAAGTSYPQLAQGPGVGGAPVGRPGGGTTEGP